MKSTRTAFVIYNQFVHVKKFYFLQAATLLAPLLSLEATDIVISDDQVSPMTINAGETVSIDRFIFGDTGSRTDAFIFDTTINNPGTLQILGGLEASGYLGDAGVASGLVFRTNVATGPAAQIWNIGGPDGMNTDDGDFGVKIAALTGGAYSTQHTKSSFTLNGDIIKTGSGMLLLCATTVTGSGNYIINEGSLKLNSGQSSELTIRNGFGQGNITINYGASLLISQNSGTLNVSRDIILNNGSRMRLSGGGAAPAVKLASNIAINGITTLELATMNMFSSSITHSLSGKLSGSGTLNIVSYGSKTANLFFSNTQNFIGSILMDAPGTLTLGEISTLGGLAVNNGTVNISAGLIVGDLSLYGGTIVLGASPVSAENISAVGNVTVDVSTLAFLLPNLTNARLFDYTGTGDFSTATWNLTGIPSNANDSRDSFTIDTSITHQVNLVASNTGNIDLTWNGTNATNVWDVNNSGSWRNASNSIPEKFYPGDNVTFDDTAACKTVNLGSDGPALVTGMITVNNQEEEANTYIFTGTRTIESTGAFIKNGAGTVIFDGTQSVFHGGLTINDGAVTLSDGGKISAPLVNTNASSLINIGAATTDPARGTGILDVPAIAGSGTIQFNHTAGADDPYYFTRDGTGTGQTIVTSGSLNVEINGGVTVFNNIQNYTGTTTINAGTLQIGDGGTTGTLGSGDVVNNGSLIFNRSNVYTLTQNISGTGITTVKSGSLVLEGDIDGNLVINNGAMLVTGGGKLDGNLLFADNTTFFVEMGALNISGILNYSGNVTINLGTSFLGSHSIAGIYDIITYSEKTGTGSFSLDTGASGINASTRLAYMLHSPTSTALKVEITNTNIASLTWAGTETNNIWQLKGGRTNWLGHATDNQFYNGDKATFADIGENKTVNIVGNVMPGTLTFTNTSGNDYILYGAGSIKQDACGILNKSGTGTVTISTEGNSYGAINVTGGSLTLKKSAILGGDITVTNATLTLGVQHTIDNVTVGDIFDMSESRKITVNDGGILNAIGGTWITSLFSTSGVQIEVNNGGMLNTTVHSMGGLGAASAFFQPIITLNEGGQWLSRGHYISANNLKMNGGTISGGVHLQTGTLSLGASTIGSKMTGDAFSLNGSVVFDVADGIAAHDFTLGAKLQQISTSVFTKAGAGTMVLSGENTYTCETRVNAGTLLINGNQTSATGAVTVANGATLGGNGIIGGKITIQLGGTLSPGNSTGVLTTAAGIGVTLESGAIFLVEITGPSDFDKLFVNGTLTLDGGAQLDILLNYTPTENTPFRIIESANLLGTFNNGVDTVYAQNGHEFNISYGADNSITLTAVPEPSTYALLGGIVTAGIIHFFRRRRRQ
ncbi:MAG: autotransporter-associated beta strand repeat-containing protein [Puniceicoccales bacterium]|jgi:fibronectin-binding autotransporter adhesin|nr:autotransporter-associated beta strand repeat-containing protein [Puniceicoccales bacterium]